MDAFALFAPVSFGAVVAEQILVDQERPNRDTLPWTGCVVA
nr:mating factor a1.3 [Pseudozyma flocculosa]